MREESFYLWAPDSIHKLQPISLRSKRFLGVSARKLRPEPYLRSKFARKPHGNPTETLATQARSQYIILLSLR